MLATDRHQRILAAIRDQRRISSAGLRKLLGVTAMTVWRDLRSLEEQGLLRCIHGGAEALGASPGEPDFEAKSVAAHGAKERIAAEAARRFVPEGGVIALEGGTTVAALVARLPATRVSIVTNSLPVALRCRRERPGLPVRVAGGWLSPVSGNTTGPEAVRDAAARRCDVCFLGCSAFDGELGPTDPNPLEIEVKRVLAAGARQVVLLVDASKFGRRSAAVTLHPRRITALVTDAPPPPACAALLRQHGVNVVVAP
jgi:DeoR/GlpR family transcriptional regulator of sugar metabolism